MSERKIIFFAILGVVVLGFWITMAVLSNAKKETGPKGPKELTVWVVWDDVTGYEDIVKSFKERNAAYKNTEVRITKFANSADYEKTLLNVIADGNSPDIFTISSDGAGVLENKTQPIPSSAISSEEFSRNFHSVFDSLLVDRQEKNEEGKEVTVSELKWIPMGYETMAAFYNLDLVPGSVPATWEELAKRASEASASDSSDTGGDSDTSSDSSDSVVLAGLGLSAKYVSNAADLAGLFFVQNGIESAANFGDSNAAKSLSEYFAFGVSESSAPSGSKANGNEFSRLKPEMDRLSISASDLFARGKVGIVFGYPSFLREIQYAIKRASQTNVLNKRNLKTTSVPTLDPKKSANLARYQYFALSKSAPNPDAALEFLIHLSDKSSQESYLSKFPYYLPARNELVDARKDQPVDKEFPRVKYESFLPIQGVRLATFDRSFPTEFASYFATVDESVKSPRAALSELDDSIKCLRRHLIEGANFDEACMK